jgi:S-adenosylmethionine:tRNA-ribosyltransferase-isomerase (queuine synthetase)
VGAIKMRDMKPKFLKSSVLEFAHYNEEEMKVKAQIKETGEIYEYYHVPLEEYLKLVDTDSVGTYYNTIFKKKFPECRKLP